MAIKYREGQHYPATYEEYVPPGAVARCMLEMMDYLYPVGCFFQTTDSNFDPNQAFGGTWSLVEEGRLLQATQDSEKIGNSVEAGLPDITGTLEYNKSYGVTSYSNGSATGAFETYAGSAQYYPSGRYQGSGWCDVRFKASNSNGIYGNSSTVQPPTILVYIWHRTA